MHSEWMTHKGQKYFFCNYAHLTDMALLKAEMDAVDEFIGRQPEQSMLILTDVRGLIGTPQVVNLFTKSATHTKKYVRKSAIIGIGFTGPRKVLFDFVLRASGQKVTVFEDLEKAKDWLVAAPGGAPAGMV